jgi:Asp/Glu/hydantoin racemase
MRRILIINPNSTESCTAAIDRAAEPFRTPGLEIVAETVTAGPISVASMADHARAQGPLIDHISGWNDPADALVIACFSDPALPAAKEVSGKPCFGLGESGMLAAMQRGMRFGIVALAEASVERQQRRVAELGLGARYAGSRAVSLSVPELADAGRTVAAMAEAGRMLIERDGADVIVMGCAGMADYRDTLADAVGAPVVEPTQAAIASAVGAALQGW